MLGEISVNPARFFLLFMIALCFGSAVMNGYAWDDEFVTTAENPHVSRGIPGIPGIFASKYSEIEGRQFGYRPVAVATFAIEYSLFGFAPGISHFINIALYALLVLLVFKLLRALLREYPLWIPFAAALVFAVHPLHNEVVVSLKNREEILVALCGFGAFWAFTRFADAKHKGLAVAGMSLLLAGFFVKISIYPFVFLIPLSLWYFEKLSWRGGLKVLAMLMSVGVVYTLITTQLLDLGMENREMDYIENPLIHTGFLQRIPVAFSVFAQYLRLFVIPVPLLAYYGLGQVDVPGWTNLSTWIGVVSSIAICWLVLRESGRNKALVFALLFAVICIAPYLNLLWLAPGIMAERFAFFSVLGFALVLVLGIRKLETTTGKKHLSLFLLGIIAIAFTVINLFRNPDWQSKETLIEADAQKAPRSVKLQTALAEIYQSKLSENLTPADRAYYYKQAEEQYRKAIAIYPGHAGAYANLGVLYATEKRLETARQHLEKAIELGYASAHTYYNLGAIHEMAGHREKAIESYRVGLALDPQHTGINARLRELSTGEQHI